MAKTINADFQAAPFLGESSFDPNEFMRRYNTTMYQQKRVQQDQNRKETAAGLAELELDLKGLYDQKGIDEVLGDNERIKNTALEIQRKGINVFAPTTPQGIKANLAIAKALDETKKKVDVIRSNKILTETMFKALQADEKLPEDQRVYDHESTRKNIEAIRNQQGSIMGTANKLETALVVNPTMGNVDKVVDANKEYITKVAVDPVTFKPDPLLIKQQKEDMKKLFRSGKLGPSEMRALERDKSRMAKMNPDKDIDVMPLEDYFIETYTTKEFLKKSKPTKVADSTDSTDSGKIGVGGAEVKIGEGVHHLNTIKYGERVYNDRYDFTTDKVMNVNSKGGEQYATIPVPLKDSKGNVVGYKKTGWKPFEASGNVEASLLFYDPKSNMLIFKASAKANLPWVENNAIFAVPVANVPEAKDFPIKFANGKTSKLGKLLPQESFGVKASDVKNPVTWIIQQQR
jgi:hypothetical protein